MENYSRQLDKTIAEAWNVLSNDIRFRCQSDRLDGYLEEIKRRGYEPKVYEVFTEFGHSYEIRFKHPRRD